MTTNINIRLEEPKDYKQVETITRDAFWNLYVPGCNEHFLAHQIRKHKDFIPSLTFVIELDGEVVGSIFYTYSKIVTDTKEIKDVITFGPVSIAPRHHNQGLGKALINHSIEAAKELGYRAIIIGGYPNYYQKYGFTGSKKFKLSMPDGLYYTGIMALPLYQDALNEISGIIHFSEAMNMDEQDADKFDALFPPKEKAVQQSQEKFQRAVAELDND